MNWEEFENLLVSAFIFSLGCLGVYLFILWPLFFRFDPLN